MASWAKAQVTSMEARRDELKVSRARRAVWSCNAGRQRTGLLCHIVDVVGGFSSATHVVDVPQRVNFGRLQLLHLKPPCWRKRPSSLPQLLKFSSVKGQGWGNGQICFEYLSPFVMISITSKPRQSYTRQMVNLTPSSPNPLFSRQIESNDRVDAVPEVFPCTVVTKVSWGHQVGPFP